MKKKDLTFVLACYMGMLIIGLQAAGYQYVLLEIATEFHMNNTQMGLLASAQFLPNLIAPLIFGGLIDKKNKQSLTIFCVSAYAVGSTIILFSSTLWMLIAGIIVLGMGGSTLPSVLTVMLSERNPAKSSYYASMIEVFYSLGTVISPIAVSFLLKGGMPWRGMYGIIGVIAVIEIGLLLWSRGNSPAAKMKEQPELIHPAEKGTIKSVMNVYGILLIGFAFVYCAIETGFSNFLTPYYTKVLSYEDGAGFALSSVGIAMTIVRLFTANMHKHKAKIVGTGCMLAGVFATCMTLFPGKLPSTVWTVLFSICAAPAWPLMMSVAVDTFPHSSGRMTTLIMLGNGIGGLLSNPIMGFISDKLGISRAYLFVAAMSIIAATLFYTFGLVKTKRRKAASLEMNAIS